MKTYLFDSDIIIDLFNNIPYAKTLALKLSKDSVLAASVLSITELRSGWSDAQAAKYMTDLKDTFAIYDVTVEIAELAGRFRNIYRRKGKSLGTVDTVLAATAIIHDFVLITRNKKDYPMPELTVYK